MIKRTAAILVLLAWTAFAPAQPVTAPPIAAKAFVLVDALSGQTLAAANETDRFEPASLTKLMTAYVVFGAMREGKLGATQAVSVSARAAKAEGSRMFLTEGKPAAVDDLLRGMIVQSG